MVENSQEEISLGLKVVNEWAQKNIRALVLFENEDLILYKRIDYDQSYGTVYKKDNIEVISATIDIK